MKISKPSKLFKYSVACLLSQCAAAYLLTAVLDLSYQWTALWMAVSAHVVIEISSVKSLERTKAFKMFILSYVVAESYLFLLAAVGAFYEFGVMALYPLNAFLFSHGPSIMFSLTVLTLITDSFTHIITRTGAAGDYIGRSIDRIYNVVMRLPYHSDRG